MSIQWENSKKSKELQKSTMILTSLWLTWNWIRYCHIADNILGILIKFLCIFFDILKIPKSIVDLYLRVLILTNCNIGSYFQFLAELYINSVFFVKLKFKNACAFSRKKTYPSRLKKINNNQKTSYWRWTFLLFYIFLRNTWKIFDDNK